MRSNNRNPLRFPVIVFTLIFVTAPPLLAGINRWTSGGPAGLSVVGLAVDPLDQSVLYALMSLYSRYSVFKSRNGGMSWSDVSPRELPGRAISYLYSLSVDPVTPSTVYAGALSCVNPQGSICTPGIIKSTDGGDNWANTNLSTTREIAALVISSGKPSTIVATDYDFDYCADYMNISTVYKTVDGGSTWDQKSSGVFIAPGTFIGDPRQPSVLYAGSFNGVYKSLDSGSTWSLVSSDLAGAFGTSDSVGRGCLSGVLAIDPRNGTTLYAGTLHGVYRSVNAGVTWALASLDVAGRAVNAIAIDPLNPETIYAGTAAGGVFRSINGGSNWAPFNAGLSNLEVHALAIDRTGTRLHIGTPTGVFDYQISVGALGVSAGIDNTTRMLSVDAAGRMSLRILDSSGNVTSGRSYGPYAAWFPSAVADGGDGLTRVLWNNEDGSVALWLLSSGGIQASYLYGPVTGWTARDVSVSRASTAHVLWTNIDRRAALWEVENSGAVARSATYGPYAGWTARAISDGPDGLTRMLWSKDDGSTGLSLIGPSGIVATYRFGPVSGWTAEGVSVASDNQARILWVHADGRMALWSVSSAGAVTSYGPVYEPPAAGQTATHLSAGPDGLTRVLWANQEGTGTLWLMGLDNARQTSFAFGPP